jgi:hypothetical protein
MHVELSYHFDEGCREAFECSGSSNQRSARAGLESGVSHNLLKPCFDGFR